MTFEMDFQKRDGRYYDKEGRDITELAEELIAHHKKAAAGAIGGKKSSKKKTAAARANGKLGAAARWKK